MDQSDRIKRIDSTKKFSVLDSSVESLLRQAKEIAGMIRYYGPDHTSDGYFDQLYPELNQYLDINRYREGDRKGEMEPSFALLITFVRQLSRITETFNERWHGIAQWYLNDILGVESQVLPGETAWLAFNKNVSENIRIRKGTGFTSDQAGSEDVVYFRTMEDLIVSDVTIEKAYALYFEKHPDIFPANRMKMPTSLRMKDLNIHTQTGKMLFESGESRAEVKNLGLLIASPALLLKEGKRLVSVLFYPEKKNWIPFSYKKKFILLASGLNRKPSAAKLLKKKAREEVLKKIISNLFYLEISTAEGWTPVKNYTIHFNSTMELSFSLPGDFPETVGCTQDIHQVETRFPALRIYLNRDAWLFPYSWIRYFVIMKINIRTQVYNNDNLLFYNELGRVDNSSPFAPFGINTERGAWFAVGNYEMAVKNVKSVDLKIKWQQLPDDDSGLYGYYSDYTNDRIDNCSFRLKATYLKDYNWFDTNNKELFYLFDTVIKDKQNRPEPQCRLSDTTFLRNIMLEDMRQTCVPESDYEYNMQAKDGFVSFILDRPFIGFGEKRYRQLFSEAMIKKAFRKKGVSMPNTPVTPLIERISLSYQAEDEIDLRTCPESADTCVYHMYPLGAQMVYPDRGNKPVSFVYNLPDQANILLGLKNVKGDELVRIYFDFSPYECDSNTMKYPVVSWYWGNGYHWRPFPDEYQLNDSTRNFSVSGMVRFYIPEITGNELKDRDGLLWFCAGISRNEESIAPVNRLYTNVVRVRKDETCAGIEYPAGYTLNMPEVKIPGISEIIQITPLLGSKPVETTQKKLMRVSEYVSHRGKAVTGRDYERILLQEFPEIMKVKCISGYMAEDGFNHSSICPGVVTLVIIPFISVNENPGRPCASSELLGRVRRFLDGRVSEYVKELCVINPVYEEIWVRCRIEYEQTEVTQSRVRSVINRIITRVVAPWQLKGASPDFGHSFNISGLLNRIRKIRQVKEVLHVSVIHLVNEGNRKYQVKEYTDPEEEIHASKPHAILVPASGHLIESNANDSFGINEMKINENFVIWRDETEIH